MRRYATLIVLAACSTKAIEKDAAPTSDPAPQVAAPQTGQHGAAIELIAISDDGSAAITQDARGGTRLWPTLDGSAEPVVVPIWFAATLAIGRTQTGYVVTARDESAGLEIVELDAAGRVLARTRVAPDPAVRDVVIDRGRVLALRADQVVVEYAPSGRVVTELPSPPGEHLQRLVTRGGRVLAIADRVGIWLEGATWGGKTPTLGDTTSITAAALSPSGTRLAITSEQQVHVVDLVAAKTLFDDFTSAPYLGVGFTDEHTVVTDHLSAFVWHPLDGSERATSNNTVRSQLAWGNGQMVHGVGRSLELTTKTTVRYLGYESHAGPIAAGPWLAKLPPDPRALTDIQPLDDDHVLVTRGNDGHANGLAVVNIKTGTYGSDLSTVAGRKVQRYEPSTGLLVLSDQIASYLVQYDRTSHKFETWYRIEYEASDLYVLHPGRTDGAIAIAVHANTDLSTVRVERFYDTDLRVGAPIKSKNSKTHLGTFLGLDDSGRAYIASNTDLVIYADGREVRRFVGVIQSSAARVVVGPNIALVDGDTVALLDDLGIERWRVNAPVTDVKWQGNTLVGVFSTGSATFDLATGALGGRTCGWGFGISTLPRMESIDEDSICEAR